MLSKKTAARRTKITLTARAAFRHAGITAVLLKVSAAVSETASAVRNVPPSIFTVRHTCRLTGNGRSPIFSVREDLIFSLIRRLTYRLIRFRPHTIFTHGVIFQHRGALTLHFLIRNGLIH